jgi:hypothetical protein
MHTGIRSWSNYLTSLSFIFDDLIFLNKKKTQLIPSVKTGYEHQSECFMKSQGAAALRVFSLSPPGCDVITDVLMHDCLTAGEQKTITPSVSDYPPWTPRPEPKHVYSIPYIASMGR